MEIETMSFEQALARLGEIVAKLENGSAPLDEALSMFAEGTALVRLCNDRLEKAEKQVKILTAGENGELTEADFDPKKGSGKSNV